jgi:hypothetical protein
VYDATFLLLIKQRIAAAAAKCCTCANFVVSLSRFPRT